jgi:hypothetical protein
MSKADNSHIASFDPEECRLLVLEEIIERGERTFIEVGKALAEIRDTRLYRKTFKSFEDYCQERWIKGRHWGGRMINAALVVEQLPSKLVTTVTNEATARALSCVPAELRPGVIEHIQDAHKPVNSSTVKEASKAVQPNVPHETLSDFEPAERAQMPKLSMALSVWALKLLELFDKCPRTEFVLKTSTETRKVIDNGIAILRSELSAFRPDPPAMCKCGCGLTVQVSETLFRAGVPCAGLTTGQAGMLISKIEANQWKLPEAFAFTRNQGEWRERQFQGKPAKKEA